MQAFNQLLISQAENIAQQFLQNDINMDGQLSFNGFKTSIVEKLSISDKKLTVADLTEVFNILSSGGNFHYANYMTSLDPKFKRFFPALNYSESSPRINDSTLTIEATRSVNQTARQANSALNDVTQNLTAPTHEANNQAKIEKKEEKARDERYANMTPLQAARAKMEKFMNDNDFTLSMLFNLLDTYNDQVLQRPEFKSKLRGLHIGLEEEEIESLFKELDSEKKGSVNYLKFIKLFIDFNSRQLAQRLKRSIANAQVTPEYIYSRYCSGNNLIREEFKDLVGQFIEKLQDFEVFDLFNKIDERRIGVITKEQFVKWFGQTERDLLTLQNVEDILRPLVTIMHRKAMTLTDIFRRYDANKNDQLNPKEIQTTMSELVKYKITADEVAILTEFLKSRYGRSEIRKSELADVITRLSPRKYDSPAAKLTLQTLNKQLQRKGRGVEAYFEAVENESHPGELTRREFKSMAYQLGELPQLQLNNLGKYLDTRNCGLIKLQDIKDAMLSPEKFDPKTIQGSTSYQQVVGSQGIGHN